MFAPQPIVMRYGQGGLFSAAANLAAAESASNDARHQQQVQLEQQRLAQQQNQFDAQQQLEQQKLQLAQAAMQQRISSTPTSAASTRQSFLTQSGPSQKALMYKTATAGVSLDPQVDQALQQAQTDPNIPASVYDQILQGAVKSAKPAAEKTASPGAILSHQVLGLDQQMKPLRSKMAAIEKMMAAKGQTPQTPPSQFNPTYADPNAATFGTMGVIGSLHDALTGGGTLVSGGDPNAMKQMMLYYGLKNQLDTLQAQRQQVLQNAIGQQMTLEKHQADLQQTQQQAQQAGPPQVSSDADYNALPSGATFIDPQGNVRRKP